MEGDQPWWVGSKSRFPDKRRARIGAMGPAMPLTLETKRLGDGTVYYGMLGELAYDADEDKVQCHLCGGWYRAMEAPIYADRMAGRSLRTATRSVCPCSWPPARAGRAI